MALAMMQVMQHKIKAVLPPRGADCCWTYGLPGKRLARALAGWKVDKLPGWPAGPEVICQNLLGQGAKNYAKRNPKPLAGLGFHVWVVANSGYIMLIIGASTASAEAINLRRGHSALELQGIHGFFDERKCVWTGPAFCSE